jgi:RES domain-containing protein/NTP pyrophosphatase (non-canonical NTP hydrolase)
MYDRDEVACHLCFNDNVLRDWIKEESIGRGKCPWCKRRGHLIYLTKLAEPFREVVNIYTQADGPDAFDRGELIGDLLDYEWLLFSESLVDIRQQLAVSILTADIQGKELYDYPDYEGLFFSRGSSLEEAWGEKAYAVLTGDMPKPPDPELIRGQEARFEQFAVAFEDLAISFELEKQGKLYRARIYEDRDRKDRYSESELGAPPVEKTKAGRANQARQPVLYLANTKSTALAEVRPWKGAAVAIAEMKIKSRLSLVDLSQISRVKSPFFVDFLKWKLDLADLLYRLAQDMSWPLMPHEQEILYKPTQLLALMVQSAVYDGCIYPSAMGSGKNYVLFDVNAAAATQIEHLRVKSAAFFSNPLAMFEPIYEEGPYDYMLEKR